MTQVKIDYNGITHLTYQALAYTLLHSTTREVLSKTIATKIERNIRNEKPWYLGVKQYDEYFNYHIQELKEPIIFLDNIFTTRASFLKYLTKKYRRPYSYVNSLIDMYMKKGFSLEDSLDRMLYDLLCSVGAENDYVGKRSDGGGWKPRASYNYTS